MKILLSEIIKEVVEKLAKEWDQEFDHWVPIDDITS